ncbi:MAG: hypothetical protein AAGA91_07900 [Pseudomonadota bacterium]
MAELKPGARLASAVCDTEVVVIAAAASDTVVSCGGAPMLAEDDTATTGMELAQDSAGGTELGKRYTNAAQDIELLCVKPGAGSLTVDGEPLTLKGAKPLPASD